MQLKPSWKMLTKNFKAKFGPLPRRILSILTPSLVTFGTSSSWQLPNQVFLRVTPRSRVRFLPLLATCCYSWICFDICLLGPTARSPPLFLFASYLRACGCFTRSLHCPIFPSCPISCFARISSALSPMTCTVPARSLQSAPPHSALLAETCAAFRQSCATAPLRPALPCVYNTTRTTLLLVMIV